MLVPLVSPGTAEAAKKQVKKVAKKPVRKAARRRGAAADLTPESARATVQVPAAPVRSPVDLAEEVAPRAPWRTYELLASARLPAQQADVELWLPSPWLGTPNYQQLVETDWAGSPARVRLVRGGGVDTMVAVWPAGQDIAFETRWRLRTRDRRFDLTRSNQPVEAPSVLQAALHLEPPRDGVADPKAIAEGIIGRLRDPLAQAHRLYEWLIDHARFTPASSGTGYAELLTQLANGAVSGNDRDINGAFVVLARAGGIPARLAGGLRVDQSAIAGSLGQAPDSAPVGHCRAEFYAHGYGWIPVDPADVCRATLLDRDVLDAKRGQVLRKLLFGFWEMNWVCLGMSEAAVAESPQPGGSWPAPRFVRADGEPIDAKVVRLHARPVTAS